MEDFYSESFMHKNRGVEGGGRRGGEAERQKEFISMISFLRGKGLIS